MKNIEISHTTIPYYDDVITDFVNDNIRYYTIQFFKKTRFDTFAPEGTGVLVFIYDEYCVFTANHVSGSINDQKNLYVQCGPDNYIPCSETVRNPDSKIKNKQSGATYLILEQEVVDQILAIGMRFLALDKILLDYEGLQSIQYAMYGYPTDFVKYGEGILKTSGFLFISSMADEVPYDKYNYTKETHYILPYTSPIDITAGSKTKSKQLYGMSGSGLWYISVSKEFDKYLYDFHLIGIMNEYYLHKKFQFIVGNKINIIINQLRADLNQSKL